MSNDIEREAFEREFPVPDGVQWCGNGYAPTRYGADQRYNRMWKAWQAAKADSAHRAQQGGVADSWRECLAEMVRAMHDYEMDVDEDAPYKHKAMMDRAHALLSTNTTPQPADGGCLCQGCGNRYQFDVIVDDETWERIKPPKKAAGGGLLCPNCIANGVHQVGTGLWSAGYLSPIEQISPQPPREQGGE